MHAIMRINSRMRMNRCGKIPTLFEPSLASYQIACVCTDCKAIERQKGTTPCNRMIHVNPRHQFCSFGLFWTCIRTNDTARSKLCMCPLWIPPCQADCMHLTFTLSDMCICVYTCPNFEPNTNKLQQEETVSLWIMMMSLNYLKLYVEECV